MPTKFTCGVYCFRNLINGKVYVGSSNRVENRRNTHLSLLRQGNHPNPHLQNAFNYHGAHNIEFAILVECSETELLGREQEFMDLYDATNREFGYNVWLTANRTVQSDEMRANLSKAHMGHKHPPEVCAKISAALRVRVRTPETRAKLSRAMTGRKLSPETIAKRTASRNYQPLSEDHKRKISDGNKGKKLSDETKRKIGEANKRKHVA